MLIEKIIILHGVIFETSYFGPRVYPKGSLVIAFVRVCVCPCVRVSVCPCVCLSLNISETVH